MWNYLIIFLFIAIALYIISEVSKIKNKAIDKDETLPYVLKDSVLTDAELHFYNSLKKHIDDSSILLVKVRLADLFYIGKGVGKNYMKYQNKINRKHVDFLICDKFSFYPKYAIELDDSSHNRQDRKERDDFVDKIYSHVGLMLIHIKAKYEYTDEDFKALY